MRRIFFAAFQGIGHFQLYHFTTNPLLLRWPIVAISSHHCIFTFGISLHVLPFFLSRFCFFLCRANEDITFPFQLLSSSRVPPILVVFICFPALLHRILSTFQRARSVRPSFFLPHRRPLLSRIAEPHAAQIPACHCPYPNSSSHILAQTSCERTQNCVRFVSRIHASNPPKTKYCRSFDIVFTFFFFFRS